MNRLTGKRKARFSPDGTATEFHLPEQAITAVLEVRGTAIPWTLDGPSGVVRFDSPPPRGTNTLSVLYQRDTDQRAEVEHMRFSELYNGLTDSRVFLYGDGSGRTLYSGVDMNRGLPSAEYFPDLYEARVGDVNSPITGMVRHFSRLLVFKPGSTWSIDADRTTLPGGGVTAAFYVRPVNRTLGCAAIGQADLLENDPLTFENGCAYLWRQMSGGTGEDRMAVRLSDRVRETFSKFVPEEIRTFHSRTQREFWVLWNGQAAIYNYAVDAWYLYDAVPFLAMAEVENRLYGFRENGDMVELSHQFRSDDGTEICALAETGAMDFERDYQQKYSPLLYVTLKPETGGRVAVTVETNRRGDYPEKVVSAGLSNFTHADFQHWSFGTNRKPQVRRVKLKVKKAAFYKLLFKSCSASATATVLEADIALRYAGKVK